MKKIHYAWAVCFACALLLVVCFGIVSNVYSAMQPFILEQNGFTNQQLASIMTVRSAVALGGYFLLRAFYRKLGVKCGAFVSMALGAAAFVIFAQAKTLGGYFAGAVFSGLAYSFGGSYLPTLVMRNWFSEKRGLALGICMAASGLAAIVLAPLFAAFVERYSLRATFFLGAGICMVMAVLTALLVRESPEKYGMLPYGQTAQTSDSAPETTFAGSKRLRIVLFAAITVLSPISCLGYMTVTVLNTNAGIDPSVAVSAFSAASIGLLLGKMIFGYLRDRFSGGAASGTTAAVLLLGQVLCAMAKLQCIPLVYAGAFLVGIGASLSSTGISVWSLDFSMPNEQAKTVRAYQIAYGIGIFVLSYLPGLIADMTGSYVVCYLIFAALSLVCAAVIQYAYRFVKKQ